MKKNLLLFILCIFNTSHDPLERLIGTWKLEKIEVGSVVYKPTGINYYLTIAKTGVGYNIGINVISTKIDTVNDSIIKLTNQGSGAPILPIGHDDPIVDYIDYTGKYKVSDSLLIIDNGMGKEYLIRQ